MRRHNKSPVGARVVCPRFVNIANLMFRGAHPPCHLIVPENRVAYCLFRREEDRRRRRQRRKFGRRKPIHSAVPLPSLPPRFCETRIGRVPRVCTAKPCFSLFVYRCGYTVCTRRALSYLLPLGIRYCVVVEYLSRRKE